MKDQSVLTAEGFAVVINSAASGTAKNAHNAILILADTEQDPSALTNRFLSSLGGRLHITSAFRFDDRHFDQLPFLLVNLFNSSARRSHPLQGLIPIVAVIFLTISPIPAGAVRGFPAVAARCVPVIGWAGGCAFGGLFDPCLMLN